MYLLYVFDCVSCVSLFADGSDKSEDWNGTDPVTSISQAVHNKSRTPCILKRRQRKTVSQTLAYYCRLSCYVCELTVLARVDVKHSGKA